MSSLDDIYIGGISVALERADNKEEHVTLFPDRMIAIAAKVGSFDIRCHVMRICPQNTHTNITSCPGVDLSYITDELPLLFDLLRRARLHPQVKEWLAKPQDTEDYSKKRRLERTKAELPSVCVEFAALSHYPSRDEHEQPIPPERQTDGSVGYDLRAALPCSIASSDTAIIPTGLRVCIPPGYEGQIRSRSGLVAKFQLSVLNGPGTIDSDFRGELMVLLHNHAPLGEENIYHVKKGDRIAQFLVKPVLRIEWKHSATLETTDTTRSTNGLGSTGHA